MNTKHTPGPWFAERDGPNNKWLINSEDFAVATCDGRFKNQQADARLIAAAPDLLDALTKIASYPHAQDSHTIALRNIARLAVTKATGEQP